MKQQINSIKLYFFGMLVIASLSYCNENARKKFRLTILNNTSYLIDSVKINSIGVMNVFKNISPKNKIEETIYVNYSGKSEGAFIISVFVKDSIKAQTTFGYYANSSDIKSRYSIEIYNNFLIKED